MDYHGTVRAECFSYRNTHYGIGEVVVIGGRRGFYVNRKGWRGDAIHLLWDDHRDVRAY